jgi:CheY-like chemotaxis protein
MNDSIVAVFIPSVSARELFPKNLPDFGKTPEKNAAAFSSEYVSYLPVDWQPDYLFISLRELRQELSEKIKSVFARQSYLYLAHHGSFENFDFILDHFNINSDHVVFEKFSRTDSDPFFNSFKRLADYYSGKKATNAYRQIFSDLVRAFHVDWQLEDKLKKSHQTLVFPKSLSIPKDSILAWNPGEYAEMLKQLLGEDRIATTEKELRQKIKNQKRLLILAELNWRHKKLSQFYGYELAKDLIARKSEKDIAFISFLDRTTLRACTPTARLLTPIFPHYRLPRDKEIEFPSFSATKWNIIRHYYLKPDGIVDKLLHDLKKLNPQSRSEIIIDTLARIQTYASILPKEAVEVASQAQKLFGNQPEQAFRKLKFLQDLLENYYKKVVSPPQATLTKSPYKIMVVEDESDTLAAIEHGLSDFFEVVKCYRIGAEALEDLQKNNRSCSALIVDMELLDNDGNWQAVQGYDLIEKAREFPHLVIYMLTVYSRRALGNIQSTMSSGKVGYLAKDPVRGLPLEKSYSAFSEELQNQIRKNSIYLSGPQNGLWKKGLLQFYYRTLESQEGADLWDDVYRCVDEFLAQDERNEPEIIPRILFHNDTKDFTFYHLKTALTHRLVCLFRQYNEHELVFQRGIRKSIGFKKSDPKQYFNTLLGFSAINVNKDEDIWKIQKQNLFEQEINWLQKRMPDDITVQFPRLIETVLDIIEYIPVALRQKIRNFPKAIESLPECHVVIEAIDQLSPQIKMDVLEDLHFYVENYPHEFKQLQQDEDGCAISKAMLLLTESEHQKFE